MQAMGRMLISLGAVALVLGAIMVLLDRWSIPKLPGDFVWRKKGVTVYVPLATSIVVSVVLTLLLNLFSSRR